MYKLKNNITGEEFNHSNIDGLIKRLANFVGLGFNLNFDKKTLVSVLKDKGRFKFGFGRMSIVILNLKIRNADGTLKKKAKR